MSEGDEAAYKAFEANLLSDLKPRTHYESQLAISIVQDQWRLNRSRGTEFNVYGQGHIYFADDNNEISPNIQAAHTMASTARRDQQYFANIALYETRLHRIIAKNEKRLAELQAERKAAEETAREQAKLLLRLAHFKGETTNANAHVEASGTQNIEANGPQSNAGLVARAGLRSDPVEANGAQSNAGLVARAGLRSDNIEANGFVFSRATLIAEINREELLKEALYLQNGNWSRNLHYQNGRPIMPTAA
jgi:hypothetical protein